MALYPVAALIGTFGHYATTDSTSAVADAAGPFLYWGTLAYPVVFVPFALTRYKSAKIQNIGSKVLAFYLVIMVTLFVMCCLVASIGV